MLGALIGLGGSLIGAGMSSWLNNQSADRDRENQEYLNAQNIALQKEQWRRDDTAYQRMVSDMKNAGLNPLSNFSSPQSSPLSANMQSSVNFGQSASSTSSAIGSAIGDMVQLVNAQKQLNMRNKELNLVAIRSGLNPRELDSFNDSDLLDTYRRIVNAQMRDSEKNANSSSGRYTSAIGKVINDVSDNLSGFLPHNKVKSVLGNLEEKPSFDGLKNEVKTKVRNVGKKLKNGLKKIKSKLTKKK